MFRTRVRLSHLLTIVTVVLAVKGVSADQQDPQVIELDGDIILGGLFPVHRRSKETENACGKIDPQPGFQYLAAMLFAIEEINNSSSLLPNITLGAKIYDTCRSQTIGADRAKDLIIYTLVEQQAPLAGVVGPFVSDVSIAVANLLRVFEIPQVSYGSTSVDLSNKELYSNFFRTVPPDSFQAHAIVDVLKEFDWDYIFTVNSYGNYGQKGMAELQRAARAEKICVASSEQLPSLPDDHDFQRIIQSFQEIRTQHSDLVNTVVVFTTQADSADMLRAAKESGATQFTWVGSNGWSNRVDVTNGNEEAADGSLTVNHLEGNVPRFEEHFRNMTPKENSFNPWFEEFWEEVLKCNIPGTTSSSGSDFQPCKDDQALPSGIEMAPVRVVINAVYAMAHALHDLQNVYCPGVVGVCDKMRKEFQRKELLRFLRNVTFPDASMNFSIRFNQNQEMNGVYDVKNFHRAEIDEDVWTYSNVASWEGKVFANNEIRGHLDLNKSLLRWGKSKGNPPMSHCSIQCNATQIRKPRDRDPECCWDCETCAERDIITNDTCQSCPLGYVPSDNLSLCNKIPVKYPSWSSGPGIAFVVLGILGLLGTTVTAVFFVKRRSHHFIKASGRELCAILFVGIALCYISSFVYLMKPTDSVCSLRRFISSVCYTTCFAPILMKTIRIYRIFKSAQKSVTRPSLTSPKSQVLISIGLIVVQLLLSTLWNISDGPKAHEVYPSKGVVILECRVVNNYTLAVNHSYNSLLMLMCTIFAFKTRNFPRNFNEAKYIGVSMYLICLMWITFIPVYLNASDAFWRVYSSCATVIIAGTIMLLGLLVPKIFILVFTNGQSPTVNESYSAHATLPNVTGNRRLSATLTGLPPLRRNSHETTLAPEPQNARSDLFLAVRSPVTDIPIESKRKVSDL